MRSLLPAARPASPRRALLVAGAVTGVLAALYLGAYVLVGPGVARGTTVLGVAIGGQSGPRPRRRSSASCVTTRGPRCRSAPVPSRPRWTPPGPGCRSTSRRPPRRRWAAPGTRSSSSTPSSGATRSRRSSRSTTAAGRGRRPAGRAGRPAGDGRVGGLHRAGRGPHGRRRAGREPASCRRAGGHRGGLPLAARAGGRAAPDPGRPGPRSTRTRSTGWWRRSPSRPCPPRCR